jgi:hypothetical protein
VNNGDSPLIVWTKETGILDVAYELKRWPKSWKIESGKAVYITSHDGGLSPFRNAGIDRFNDGNTEVRPVNTIHQAKTERN